MTHADWRRENVNIFIKRVYEETMALKPWVKFGVSPSGIYRNGVSVGGSATSGSEHYSAVYADSKKWLQEKYKKCGNKRRFFKLNRLKCFFLSGDTAVRTADPFLLQRV